MQSAVEHLEALGCTVPVGAIMFIHRALGTVECSCSEAAEPVSTSSRCQPIDQFHDTDVRRRATYQRFTGMLPLAQRPQMLLRLTG